MAGEADKTVAQLQEQASAAFDSLQKGASGDAKASLNDLIRDARDELAKRGRDLTREDNDAAREIYRSVENLANQAGVDEAKKPAREVSEESKESQAKTGAAGPATGLALPRIVFIGEYMDKLKAARCRLCTYLRTAPANLRSTLDQQSVADWDGARKKLVVEMILAEEELLDETAAYHVPYSPEDEARLEEGYSALASLLGKFEDIKTKDKGIAQEIKNLHDYVLIHEGLQGGLRGGVKDDPNFKAAKKVAGYVKKGGEIGETLGKRDHFKKIDEMASKDGGNRALRSASNYKKGMAKAGGVASKLGKMGGKGELGQALVGAAGGIVRLCHQESQRALMRLENANAATMSDVKPARESLASAHADVIERRQSAALDLINKRLADAGEPPLRLHTMSAGDTENYLDAPLREMHLSGSVEKNFGAEAAKRSETPPTSKLLNFRRNHGDLFDDDNEKLLLQWCETNCPEKKKSKKTAAVLGGTAALLIAIVGFTLLQNDKAEPLTSAGPGDVMADAPAGNPSTSGGEVAPSADPPGDPAPQITTLIGTIGEMCPTIFHTPSALFPNSFSWVLVDGFVVAIQGELDDGMTVLNTPGSDLSQIEAPVTDGLFSAVMPISVMTEYQISVASYTSNAGEAIEMQASPIVIQVGPQEGPIEGCTPPQDLSAAERDSIRAANAVKPGAGPGGPAVIVDPEEGGIPAPEDDLAPYREFLTRFDAAHRDGDVATLIAMLDPATISRYGASQCQTYLEGVVGSIGDIRLLDGALDSPWTYADGASNVEISGAWNLQIELSILDGPLTTTNFHLRDSAEGVRWFTDCGEPLP